MKEPITRTTPSPRRLQFRAFLSTRLCLSTALITSLIGLANPLQGSEIQPYQAESIEPIRSNTADRPAPVRQPAPVSIAAVGSSQSESILVDSLRCSGVQCELDSGSKGRAASVNVTGSRPDFANARLTLVVIDEAKTVVQREIVLVGSDGSFQTAVSARNLPEGRYKFGFVTPGTPQTVIAGGEISIQRRAAAPQAADNEGAGVSQKIAGLFERSNTNASKQSSESARESRTSDRPTSSPAARGASDLSDFFQTFGLAIPGVAYTTDNYATNTRTVTVATGTVTKSAVRINPDGTYIWNSAWDGKVIRGQWKRESSAIILLNAQSGLNWRMERMRQPQGKATVTLWDQNSIYYHGTPLP